MSKVVEHLTISDSNTSGVMNALFSFDTIFDTDFGILALISQHFFDTSVFKKDFFIENKSVNKLKDAIINRECENPLKLCIIDQSNADDFYDQFMFGFYPDILQVSMVTDLGNIVNSFINSGIHCTILCNKQDEIDLIKSIPEFNKFDYILKTDIDDPDKYNQFFFKSLDDTNLINIASSVRDKTFYIAKYKYNTVIEKDKISLIEHPNILLIELNRNRVNIIDLYSNEKEKTE